MAGLCEGRSTCLVFRHDSERVGVRLQHMWPDCVVLVLVVDHSVNSHVLVV